MDAADGTQIGPYRIDARLGAGGMGVVYRAHDTRLQRTVAIKFLSGELSDSAARQRFQREAQTASSLNHPHILTVYDTGDFEGSQYLVTEFVDSGTLRDWLRTAKPDWRAAVELLVGIADGLAAAHEAGTSAWAWRSINRSRPAPMDAAWWRPYRIRLTVFGKSRLRKASRAKPRPRRFRCPPRAPKAAAIVTATCCISPTKAAKTDCGS